jgi:stage II sporulation protein D
MPAKQGISIALAVALAAIALLVPAFAGATVKFKIRGAGWGHGVGMSQYGAYGYAKHGRGHRWILEHYYRETQIGKARSRQVKVLLNEGVGSVEFTRASRACGRKLSPDRVFKAGRKGSDVVLRKASGKRIKNCGDRLKASGSSAIQIGGEGRYRGKLIAEVRGAGGLYVINGVPLEGYVKGVVPNEMPAEWPAKALRAQAVTARSYGIATGKSGVFDHYEDTRSQVYGGKRSETRATNRAVGYTDGEVVKHNGDVAITYFFSTSGGETENVEYGFVGANPSPYLKGVKDAYDDASPYHRWTVTYSRREMQNKLGGLVEGRLRNIDVTKRGTSPRIVYAKIKGSAGGTKVSGPTLQAQLDLRSTWARFEKKRR